ncbi:hypothetical protein H9P43_000914 [Blastocladiella emersonii ATCC 22665]|nr:hypothetical protein H9P43_000914 [Blastocladiella emersonii ATCC 22665]
MASTLRTALAKVPTATTAVFATGYGNADAVLKIGKVALPAFGPSKVHVRLLAAPVNPSDINAIQGRYPVDLAPSTLAGSGERALLPGFEGVAEVVSVGDAAARETHADLASPIDASPYLAPGDWVIPAGGNFGTWRRDAVVAPADLIRVVPAARRGKLSAAAAATLSVNPSTAYRMLRDFGELQPGDVVVQNAANSAVGQYVIQLAKLRGVRTVNLVRDRPEFDALAAKLTALGADHVVRDGTGELRALLHSHRGEWTVKLALNAVGGKSATELTRALSAGGTMVSYGAMSREPITVPTASFIFNDLRLRGFWMSKWKKVAPPAARRAMLDDLIKDMEDGKIVTPEFAEVSLPEDTSAADEEAVVKAVASAGSGFLGKKIMLTFP